MIKAGILGWWLYDMGNRLYNRSFSCLLRPVVFWKKLVPLYKLLAATVARLFMR